MKLALLFLLFTTSLTAGLQVGELSCTSAVLVNRETGKVLYAKNPSKQMYPASCTKIAFALYAIKFHQGLFNKTLVGTSGTLNSLTEAQKSKNNFGNVPSYILERDASHIGLKVGEEMRFYDLLEATMIPSGDDASNLIAEAMGGGSIDRCVQDVNRYLASLGCKSTSFTNPHGLHHPNHVTTAYDLALLCQEAMKEPIFCKMAKAQSFVRPKTNKQHSVTLQQTNRLLVKGNKHYYPFAVGIKTGYHRRAGYCLAAQADKDGRSLIAVVLQGKTGASRFEDTKKLFEAAFNENKITKELLAAGSKTFLCTITGADKQLEATSTKSLNYSFYPSEEPNVRCQLVWHDNVLPIKKGALVGELQLIADGRVTAKADLFATDDLDMTMLHKIKKHVNIPVVVGALIFVVALFVFLRTRRT
ncbi:MAG: D-alanyl-D-alanine carboxypeptidase [Verrucomicrobia bacterium]|nr:D-alanyl-D-alanine carboxypeptidase [Verrucomicrobiota bacterium]